MSGHSKWAQIKRQKGAADAKRGVTFTKLSNAISIAVKQGGGIGDPNQNFRLRLAIDTAKAANMPKENIERAIQRAVGKQGDSLEEVMYEGFGPGGIRVIVEAATDNKNRTTAEIKNIFEKYGGSMGQIGSVAYQFTQLGRILIEKGQMSIDEIFLQVADSGAEDIEEGESEVIVYTKPSDLTKVRDNLLKKQFIIKQTELIRKPLDTISITNEDLLQKIITFLDKLEEHDDVQHVYSNLAFT